MTKQEYLENLGKMHLPKEDFIILSGGSLLLRGIREKTSDFDLSVSKNLAEKLDLYNAPKDSYGCYTPFENCQMIDNYDDTLFDIVDGYKCETLESILDFKRKMGRPKDLVDIKNIEKYLRDVNSKRA